MLTPCEEHLSTFSLSTSTKIRGSFNPTKGIKCYKRGEKSAPTEGLRWIINTSPQVWWSKSLKRTQALRHWWHVFSSQHSRAHKSLWLHAATRRKVGFTPRLSNSMVKVWWKPRKLRSVGCVSPNSKSTGKKLEGCIFCVRHSSDSEHVRGWTSCSCSKTS